MTPGNLTIQLYQGAKYEELYAFTQTSDGTPVDLTGLEPFVMTLTDRDADLVKATAECDNTDLAGGQLTFRFPSSVTRELALGTYRLGMRDNLNNPYIVGTAVMNYFAPRPA